MSDDNNRGGPMGLRLQELKARLTTSVATTSPTPEPVIYAVLDLERRLVAGDPVRATYALHNARGTRVGAGTRGTVLEVSGRRRRSARYQVQWEDGSVGWHDPSELGVESTVARRRPVPQSRKGGQYAASTRSPSPTASVAPSSASTSAAAPTSATTIVWRIVMERAASSPLGAATIGSVVDEAAGRALSEQDVHRILRALAAQHYVELLREPRLNGMWLARGSIAEPDGSALVYARALHRAADETHAGYRVVWTTEFDHPERNTSGLVGTPGGRTYASTDVPTLESARTLARRMRGGADDRASDFVAEVGIAATTQTGGFAGWIEPPQARLRTRASRTPASSRPGASYAHDTRPTVCAICHNRRPRAPGADPAMDICAPCLRNEQVKAGHEAPRAPVELEPELRQMRESTLFTPYVRPGRVATPEEMAAARQVLDEAESAAATLRTDATVQRLDDARRYHERLVNTAAVASVSGSTSGSASNSASSSASSSAMPAPAVPPPAALPAAGLEDRILTAEHQDAIRRYERGDGAPRPWRAEARRWVAAIAREVQQLDTKLASALVEEAFALQADTDTAGRRRGVADDRVRRHMNNAEQARRDARNHLANAKAYRDGVHENLRNARLVEEVTEIRAWNKIPRLLRRPAAYLAASKTHPEWDEDAALLSSTDATVAQAVAKLERTPTFEERHAAAREAKRLTGRPVHVEPAPTTATASKKELKVSRLDAAERIAKAFRRERYTVELRWDRERPHETIFVVAERGTRPREIGVVEVREDGTLTLDRDFALHPDRQRAANAIVDQAVEGIAIDPSKNPPPERRTVVSPREAAFDIATAIDDEGRALGAEHPLAMYAMLPADPRRDPSRPRQVVLNYERNHREVGRVLIFPDGRVALSDGIDPAARAATEALVARGLNGRRIVASIPGDPWSAP